MDVDPMTRPEKLPAPAVEQWLEGRSWTREADALVRTFVFPDFRSALAFVVSVGCWAERRDHHPDVELGWGRVRLRWTTHDAGGITRLDLEGAEASDGAAPR